MIWSRCIPIHYRKPTNFAKALTGANGPLLIDCLNLAKSVSFDVEGAKAMAELLGLYLLRKQRLRRLDSQKHRNPGPW